MATKRERITILDGLLETPLVLSRVVQGANGTYEKYIANLILQSNEIYARRSRPWEYKSLTEYGEEGFVVNGQLNLWSGSSTNELNGWHREASKAYAYSVCVSLLYVDDEGMILFVRDGESFRPARKGDAPYDFAKRLISDEVVTSQAFDKPQSWANELFINAQNLEAYATFWHDIVYEKDQNGNPRKRKRTEAVWRETLKLMAVEPFASAGVPDPETWANGGLDTQADVLEKPLITRERDTLLTIIAALAKVAKVNLNEAGKAALSIEGWTAELGARVSKRAIEEHLKRIPDALETRMK